ncbi:MAG TPA: UdgX family uracil-DNA binding protein [Polyangia bacterium]|jgi:DNA polymerase
MQGPSHRLQVAASHLQNVIDVVHAPARPSSLAEAAAACRGCRNCPLYLHATQAVFGEGPIHARLMLVGEQPGDEEDRRGHPFVGPAGALLDRALADAGVSRSEVYVTNAVKHFKFIERGKRRLHDKPKGREIRACSPWLRDELRLVAPRMVVALGATATTALFGSKASVMRDRGRVLVLPSDDDDDDDDARSTQAVLTVHPSAALRAPTSARRQELREMLVSDLALAWKATARANE